MHMPHRRPRRRPRYPTGAGNRAAEPAMRLAKITLAGALLLGIITALEGAAQTAAAQAGPVDPAAIQAILDRAVDEGVASGAIALVSHRGEIIFQGSAGNLEPDAVVGIASSTKPIVAALLVALASDGLLDLDTPISTWLPEWEQVRIRLPPAPAPRAPTVRELLSHTSWIPPLHRGPEPPAGTLADLSRTVAEGGLRLRLGNRFNYGGVSYEVAAHVAEAVTGRPFEALLEERLLTPLGMNDTRFGGSQGWPVRAVTAEPLDDPVRHTPTPSGRWVAAGGGLSSTLDDLHRFWSLHLPGRAGAEGSPLTEEAVLELRTPTASNPRRTPFGADYGLGHYLDRLDPAGTPRTLSHGGAHGSMPWIDLDRELIAIVVVPGALGRAMPVILEVRALLDAAFSPEPAGLLDEAREALDRGWGAATSPERREYFVRGEELAREALALLPDDAEARWSLVAALGLRGQEEAPAARIGIAREVHREAAALLAKHPEHPGGHHAMGRLHGSILRLNPAARWFYLRLAGEGELRAASWERAEEHLRRAIELQPGAPHHRVELARLLLETGRPAEAAREARIAIALPETTPLAHWYRGWAGEIVAELEARNHGA